MAGLQNNSQNNSTFNPLTQWYQLFKNKNIRRSNQAYMHWKNAEQLGLPNCKHENWKYTPLEKLLTYYFSSAIVKLVSISKCNELSLPIEAYRLIFINGKFISTLSDKNIGLWQIAIENGTKTRRLPKPVQSEFFLHLIESLSSEVTFIKLPFKKKSLKPLYLLHINQGNQDNKTLTNIHYRHHIELEYEAHGQVIEHFVNLDNYHYFNGARTSIIVSNNAKLDYVKLIFEKNDNYHIAHNDIMIGSNAIVNSNTFISSDEFVCNQSSIQLNGEKTNVSINSLLLPSSKKVNDVRTYLEHNRSNCQSSQLHKIIASDYGKGVFHGLIKIAKDVSKINGVMLNNNLLIDHLAQINTKPQLEIYSDDVKCSHGVTIGHIDDEQIFYLRSRGIPYNNAKKMIIYAFISEITEFLKDDIMRDCILSHILKKVII